MKGRGWGEKAPDPALRNRCASAVPARYLCISYFFFLSITHVNQFPTYISLSAAAQSQASSSPSARGGSRKRRAEDRKKIFPSDPLKRKARRRRRCDPKRDERFGLRSARAETTTAKGPGQFLVARVAVPRLQDCSYGLSHPLQAILGALLIDFWGITS